MDEQQLFSERMNGLLDLAMDKSGMLSKGEIHFYLKDVLQSEEQYEFVYQFFAEKGVRVEGWRGNLQNKAQPGDSADSVSDSISAAADDEYGNIEDFTGLMGTQEAADTSGRVARKKRKTDESGTESDGETGKTAIEEYEEIEGSAVSEEETGGFDPEDEDEDDEVGSEAEDLPLPAGIDESVLTEDEKRYLKYYQSDLNRIEPVTEQERNSLLNALAAGDLSVLNRLVEGHLYLVMEEIPAYMHAGVSVGDLIQEASIGLIEGIQSYRGMNFEAHVRYAIRESLDAITEEQQTSDSVAKHLLDSISRADEATRRLSEDLGRAPTKEELAKDLRMDVDEVETILKHSIDALTVSVSDEAYGKTDDAED